MNRAARLWQLGFGWWGLLLLCLARGLAAGDYPPLVAEGEAIDDPEGIIAGIIPHNEADAVAFSPDGRLLASASEDGAVRLWDPATGAIVRDLEGHEGRVNAIAFNFDGRRLASASKDNTVRLWDPATGSTVKTMPVPVNTALPDGSDLGVSAVAFSPDGRLLATASANTVTVWDPATGKALHTFIDNDYWVRAVAFSPDGRLLASASVDKTVRLWDPATGAVVRTLEGHQAPVNAVAFSRDGRLLASASVDSTVRLWDLATREARTLQGHRGPVYAVAFRPDGRLLASASFDHTLRLWDPASGAPVNTLDGHTDSVHGVAFSPDGRLLASGSYDKTVRLWDLATGAAVRSLQGHGDPLNAVAFSPDGRLLAAGSQDDNVSLWDLAKAEVLRTLEGDRYRVSAVAFSPDGSLLAGASQNLRLWDLTKGAAPVQTVAGPLPFHAVAFSPDGQTLAINSSDEVSLVDTHTWQALDVVYAGDEINSVAFSPGGRLLASATRGNTHLRDLQTRKDKLLLREKNWVNAVAFSPDGRLLASALADKTVRLWDLAKGKVLAPLKGHQGAVNAVAFRPDGHQLASASDDHTVRLWDPAKRKDVHSSEGHRESVTAVAFSPDGRLLASASWDNTVRLWDPKSGVCKAILASGHDGAWVACRPAEGRCWRHDDGSLLVRHGANGLLTPVPPPAGAEPARLEIAPSATPAGFLTARDGRTAEVTVQIANQGAAPAYWLRIHQARDQGDPLLYTPPRVHPRLDPGQSVDLTGQVSYLASWTDPQPHSGTLRLQVDHAHGTAGIIEVPVRAEAPRLTLAAAPALVAGKVRTLAVRLRNAGGQDLEDAEIEARVPGLPGSLPRQTQDRIGAGTESPLSFALPADAELPKDARLTLVARERSYPPHGWTFADLPIRLPTPPWQLYSVLVALILTLSALLWALRQYTHPLTRRLAADPSALPRLGLGELPRARALLRRTRRLPSVLTAAGVEGRWLDQAIRFRTAPPEGRVRWLAERLGAGWQRIAPLESADGGHIERFELALGDAFPLNLSSCTVAFPPTAWPAQDVLTTLGTGGDRPCLILSGEPSQTADLSRLCRSPETWWVAPEDGELSALLLAPTPVDAFTRLIAGYVKAARISPYQTSLGVRKDKGFFGRTRILADILNREPANYLLVGGRQLGKSSLLLELHRRYARDPGVDCRYLQIGQASIESRLAGALGLPADAGLVDLLEHLARPAPRFEPRSEPRSERARRRVLLLDEADDFVAADAARGYACLNGFRSLSEEGRCHFILAGFWGLYRSAVFDYQSPIKNFAQTIQVGALEPEACRDLAVKPMQALGLTYADETLVDRILERTGGRANLIAILCDQMLQGLGLTERRLTATDLDRALASESVRAALEGWGALDGRGPDSADARLDRMIVYGLIGRETFTLAQVLDLLAGLGVAPAPERIRESLTRLELAFITGREGGVEPTVYRWQVPLWRDRVLAGEPGRMLEQERRQWRPGVK